MSNALRKIDVVVTSLAMVAKDIKVLELGAVDYAPLPPVKPGAHIDLWLPDGAVRQYSIIEATADGLRYRIAVLRDPASRGGSTYIVEQLSQGQTLQISGPRNHFELDEGGDEYLLFAGGIGITPILPMARRLAARGKFFTFHYLVRSRGRAAFLDELVRSPFADRVRLHIDDEDGVPNLKAMIGAPRPSVKIYVCGPSGLIEAVLALTKDWPDGMVHFERFSRGESACTNNKTFEIELARSNVVLSVSGGQSILEVLQKAGILIDSVCREGICGTCAVTVLAGEIDHRDSIQTEEEKQANRLIYVCISRAKSPRLVLDL